MCYVEGMYAEVFIRYRLCLIEVSMLLQLETTTDARPGSEPQSFGRMIRPKPYALTDDGDVRVPGIALAWCFLSA
jgi:hypothetical protein